MSERVQMLVMDVDGTLTDGKIHISAQGELFKSFCVKDGYAIRHILSQNQIIPVIITGRSSLIVDKRCEELGIIHVYQGVEDKAACLQNVALNLNIPLEKTACIGDDENDLPMMKICGIKGCPADAVKKVIGIADYICTTNGGYGAVREFIEWLVEST